ncbi:phosphatase PAP2 family protein [Capnocytophaga cynodegmi]|uniref:phosphatase PAP2 family protein n=1 Tax=Capnocytophaga cynodegmi TaxID=28189 RepID=UPI00385E183B
MFEFIIEKDKELLLYLNSLGSERWDGFWLFVSHKFSALPLYISLLFLCLKFLKWRKTLVILLCVALMIVATDQLANLFKYGFERLRPCHDETLISQMRHVICGGKYGYFSAHAASSMAVATFFSLLFHQRIKWLSFVLLSWSFLVGYSRIYLGVHFPGDIITGFVLGGILGYIFYKIAFEKILKK